MNDRKLLYIGVSVTEIKVFPFILNRPMNKDHILPRVTSFIDSLFTAIENGSLCKGQLQLLPVSLLFVDI